MLALTKLRKKALGLGIYTNEMQRSVGFGGNCPGCNIPYSQWNPYRPGSSAYRTGPYDYDSNRYGLKGFGDVPNDFEASVDLQYIPVRQGWYYGMPVDGRGYPDNGLGADATITDKDVTELVKIERLQTVLQVISTLSIATIATLTIMKAISGK